MEQSAMSGVNRSGVPFKPQRPFYAIDGYYTKDSNGNIITNSGSRTVPCGLWSNVIGDFVVENRFADTDWQMNQAVMDSCINYVVASGLQYFNFEYYPNGNNGSLMRNLFEQNNNKRGVKAAYSIGLLGGNPDNYPDPNDDYTKNLNQNKKIGFICVYDINPNMKASLLGIMDREVAKGLPQRLKSEKLTYAEDSLRALVEHLFTEEWNMHRLEAYCFKSNKSPRKLVEKVGFKKEGELRESGELGDKFENVIVYGLLKGEYKNG